MNGVILTCEQRTPQWYAARAGRLTGSRAGDMTAQIKTGEAAARRDLRLQLVCERLTGQAQEEQLPFRDIQRGVELEATALAAYEAQTGYITRRVGFVEHGTYLAGCSPDALVNKVGIVEVKCPKPAIHLGYIRGGKVLPKDYRMQMLHNLWITGAQWCDFVSFNNSFPAPLQLFTVRVLRTDTDIETYEKTALDFLAEVEKELGLVQAMIDERTH